MTSDTKYKDALPRETVERIRGILAAHGIDTEESAVPSGVKNCCSMRVSVKGVEFGANGKGMTEEYSRASGYAEFMERMQAGYLQRRIWRDQMVDFPDEKQMSFDECGEACADWVAAMQRSLSELFGRSVPTELIRRKLFEAEGESETVTVIPFYNPLRDRMCWFPKKAIPFLYSTNGLAAGNNLVEASVQSLSEIYERRNLVRMFFGSVVPPTIPDEYLRRFPKPYEVIQSLREAGLEVLVKDCSLGEPFPLVAAVVIDRARHAYHVHLGGFPVFEIALERSFTEMFQGRTLQGVADTDAVAGGDARQRSNAELIRFLTVGSGRYPLSFFSEPPSYPFRPFPDRSAMSNEDMLREYLDYMATRGHEPYIRDISHLGFPSVRILVPGVSEIMPNQLLDSFPIAYFLERYKDAPLRLEELDEIERAEFHLLLDQLAVNYGQNAYDLLFLSGKNLDKDDRNVSRFLGRMIYAWLEWERDPAGSVAIARSALPAAKPEDERYLSCLAVFFEHLAAGGDRERIRSGAAALYGEDTAAEADRVLAAGENPFARYLVRCAPSRCPDCPYRAGCTAMATDAFVQKIRGVVAGFDSEAAFARLRRTFLALRA